MEGQFVKVEYKIETTEGQQWNGQVSIEMDPKYVKGEPQDYIRHWLYHFICMKSKVAVLGAKIIDGWENAHPHLKT